MNALISSYDILVMFFDCYVVSTVENIECIRLVDIIHAILFLRSTKC